MFVAPLVVLPVLLASQPTAAAPIGTGSISGRVVDADGVPVSGICADVDGGPGALTDLSGTFSITGLDTGSYKVGFSDCNPTPRFLTQWYLDHPDSSSADPVLVTDAVDTPLPDVTLLLGVSVSGTVTDTNGTPIPNISVNVNPTDPGASSGTQTDATGVYTAGLLPPGDYKVHFSDQSPSPVWASEYWNDQPSWNTADTVTLSLADGPTHAGIDAELAADATIEGTVQGPGGAPVSGICVDANVPHNGGYDWVGGTTTGAAGEYTIGQLPAGDLRVQFRDCQNGPYVNQWYDGGSSVESSTPVVLSPGEVRRGVDAQLAEGVAVSGTVTDANGNPIAGISVNVNPADQGANAWAQTDSSGRYTTNALPPGTYRVEFHDWSSNPTWGAQYWDGKLSQSTATPLTLADSDGPVRANIDATLSPGARVAGTVTAAGGGPVAGLCVIAVVAGDRGPEWIADARTASSGAYTITGLPATPVKILFQDCNTVGPYVDEWWDNQPGYDAAAFLTLQPGITRTGIDAQLAPAGLITGLVTDGGGDPLEGICVQASTATFVGGLALSDSAGRYSISLAQSGTYKVQFVDCTDTPEFAGEWWDNQPSAATAQVVNVVAGQAVGNVDAELAHGAVGTISGKVVNLNGVAMTSACVVVYLANGYALFGSVNPDGTYAVSGVPSGTYALAFLGCNGGEPEAVVPDPQTSAVSYKAVWWHGEPVALTNSGGGPDPIVQGADLVTVTPGQHRTGFDWCFGCTAIVINSITPGKGWLTVAFTTPYLASPDTAGARGASAAQSDVAAELSYMVTCTSTNGGVSGSASGPSSPITVAGLTPGAVYTCRVTASADGVTLAASPLGTAVVPVSSHPSDPSDPSVITVAVPTAPAAPAAGTMARTGTNIATAARFAATLLALGLTLVVGSRRWRRNQEGSGSLT